MARPGHLPISLTRRGGAGGDARCSVVWLDGEHDVSTKLALAAVIDRAADLDGGDIVVDLSGVTFMDASIIGTFVGARNRLRRAGRSLSVRMPSAFAVWLLDLSRSVDLVSAPAAALHPLGSAAALGTWVEVPRRATTAASYAIVAEPAIASSVVRGRS